MNMSPPLEKVYCARPEARSPAQPGAEAGLGCAWPGRPPSRVPDSDPAAQRWSTGKS
jgi:hypothetical protein